MDLPIAYVETSIPSFYFDVRTSPDIVARRNWTRQWWDKASSEYHLVTSIPVIEELSLGIEDHAANRVSLVAKLPLLALDDAIDGIVATYVKHKVMPQDPGGDAVHLAFASFYKCDFLVTWNCQHLANANKFGHIRIINTMLGLFVPQLVTPMQLLGISA